MSDLDVFLFLREIIKKQLTLVIVGVYRVFLILDNDPRYRKMSDLNDFNLRKLSILRTT